MSTVATVLSLLCIAAPAGSPCNPAADIVITTSPNPVPPGDPVTITVSNVGTTCTYMTSVCIPIEVHHSTCDGPIADFNPCMLPAEAVIGPGQSWSGVWDGTGPFGSPLPEGVYGFPIYVVEKTSGGFHLACGSVQVGHVPCPATEYGSGKPGLGGVVPRLLATGGFPKLGNATFQLFIDKAPSGTLGLVLLGSNAASVSAPWGTLLVDVGTPHLQFPIVLATLLPDGSGTATIPLPIPPLPSLAGLQLFSQALLADAGATFGISHTSGTTFSICP